MEASTFALSVIAGTLGFAAIPGWVAHRRNELFWTDWALVLMPAPVFSVAAYLFNPKIGVGWGWIIYPYLALVIGVLLAYVRIFVFSQRVCNSRLISRISLGIICFGVFAAGITVPPWYE